MKLTPEMIAHAAPVQFYSHLGDDLAAVSFSINGSYLDIIFFDGYPIYYRDLMKVIGRWFDPKMISCHDIVDNIDYLMNAFKVVRRSRRTDEMFNKVEDNAAPIITAVWYNGYSGADLTHSPMDVVWETLIKIRYVKDGGDFRLFLKDLTDEITKAREGAFVVS